MPLWAHCRRLSPFFPSGPLFSVRSFVFRQVFFPPSGPLFSVRSFFCLGLCFLSGPLFSAWAFVFRHVLCFRVRSGPLFSIRSFVPARSYVFCHVLCFLSGPLYLSCPLFSVMSFLFQSSPLFSVRYFVFCQVHCFQIKSLSPVKAEISSDKACCFSTLVVRQGLLHRRSGFNM